MASLAQAPDTDLEPAIHAWGERIFRLMEAAGEPSLFSKKGFYGALMECAMEDTHFKTQLFRFVDVLPSLNSSAEIARHLREYLGEDQVHLRPALRAALKASTGAAWLLGSGVKAQVTKLAHQFMLGDDEKEIVRTLRQLHDQHIGFTMDVLGETVVSEREADAYAQRYLQLLALLARETAAWPENRHSAATAAPAFTPLPVLNLSLKISALYSQIHPTDPDTALEKISARLRPILRRAQEVGALINFDMEQYALKDLTLRLFKNIFQEPEFVREPACGLALQAYLKDCESDLQEVISWAKTRSRRIAVRLVKGAYWDYETVVAAQKGWPAPVFGHKPESDANFEALSVQLLENATAVEPAFGTHNVRSIAHVLAWAERLQLPPTAFEFQMLYGMADPLKAALVQLGFRVCEYCPVGELLPGMAYLVRRLLENTSNEGFLARSHSKKASHEELLQKPKVEVCATVASSTVTATQSAKVEFRNEPPTDFTKPAARAEFHAAINESRASLGRRYPLIIGGRSISTDQWLPSLNPANQKQVVGYAAQATLEHAEAALRAARAAHTAWARTPAAQRAECLEQLAAVLHRDKAKLCALEMLEAGKHWTEADADVAEAIDFCRYYASVMRDFGRAQTTQRVPGESNYQEWRPRGAGLIVAPWNFPLAILTGMTTAAVVAGNAIVMKPSDQTPVIGAALMTAITEAGVPPGVVNLLTGPGSTVGAYLAAHAQIDFIAFTGSKEVGLRIWEAAGRTAPGQTGVKKVVCEMGGKNAIIVDTDADLDEAVLGCIASAFGYQGQKCSALSRLIILSEIADRFISRLIDATASLRVGPAEEPGNVLGPVISREAQERILAVVKAGRDEATLVWQGKVPDDPNACYVPPTIFKDVPPESRLFREEIFGPVLAITSAKNFDQALALANASEFALTGGLYSRSPINIERAKANLVCGNLYINRFITGAIVQRQPFGGFKMSGGGTKAGGREYLENFMVPRVVSENTLRRGFAADQRVPEEQAD